MSSWVESRRNGRCHCGSGLRLKHCHGLLVASVPFDQSRGDDRLTTIAYGPPPQVSTAASDRFFPAPESIPGWTVRSASAQSTVSVSEHLRIPAAHLGRTETPKLSVDFLNLPASPHFPSPSEPATGLNPISPASNPSAAPSRPSGTSLIVAAAKRFLSGQSRGKKFEGSVRQLLAELVAENPDKVEIKEQPRVELQNGEFVVPDFYLKVELIHEINHYYIECQSRNNSSKAIFHKIQHVRHKQRIKTFIFVHENKIAEELARSMDSEGIIHMNLDNFSAYIRAMAMTLALEKPRQLDIGSIFNIGSESEFGNIRNNTNFSKPDRAMMSG